MCAALSAEQLFKKPVARQGCDFVQRMGFFKKVAGARNDLQLFLALHEIHGAAIQIEDRGIGGADNQQGRCFDPRKGLRRKIRPPSA